MAGRETINKHERQTHVVVNFVLSLQRPRVQDSLIVPHREAKHLKRLPKQSTWSWYLYDGKAVSHSLGERASFDVTMKLPSCVCVDDDVVVGGVGAMTRALLEGISEVRGITGLTTEMGGRFAVNISSRNLIPRLSESAIDICCGASSSCLLPYCSSILSCNEQART